LKETRKTNNVAQRRRTKQSRTKTTKSRKKKRNRCENHLFHKREIEKRVRGVILGQKLTLNHPSLVDEGEKTRVLMTAHKRETTNLIILKY